MNRAALVTLATRLDEARQAANAIEATAPQRGVYGKISEALEGTLALIVGEANAPRTYEFLLDGNTVPEALDLLAKEAREAYGRELRGEGNIIGFAP